MEFLADPSIWMGLVTLVVLEIVLGIDNLVFIAILADKLPPHQRDKARIIGLSLAMLMRLGLLTIMSHLITLTKPLFTIMSFSFSGRDLIMLLGGVFLLFKATTELHERLEGSTHGEGGEGKAYAGFWVVVIQIIILDAVFSLDAVITAVGMVEHLWVMMTAVVIAMGLMLFASKPLTRFVNSHPTVVVLCLSFLLMIGLSLVAEGFGFGIPKGYLYAAIGFSILIEFFNQVARRNFLKQQSHRPLRERTAEAIMRLMGGRERSAEEENQDKMQKDLGEFAQEERYMIGGVLTLASRNLRSIMTPRNEIVWINLDSSPEQIKTLLMNSSHTFFPVCRGELDEIIGIARAKDVLMNIQSHEALVEYASQFPPIIVPESMEVINLLSVLRKARGRQLIVSDEFGVVQGLITPLDLLEAIAGEFPDEDETPNIVEDSGGLLVKGGTNIHTLALLLDNPKLISAESDYSSVAGLLLAHFGQLPNVGDSVDLGKFHFEVLSLQDYRIDLVRISRIVQHEENSVTETN